MNDERLNTVLAHAYSAGGDESAVASALADTIRDGGEITDATARVIASWWHDGSTLTYGFVSTGAIADPTDLYRALFTDYHRLSSFDKLCADYMGTYLVNAGTRGPVDGWSDLWVR